MDNCKYQQQIRKNGGLVLKCSNKGCKKFKERVDAEYCVTSCPMRTDIDKRCTHVERSPSMEILEPQKQGNQLFCEYTPHGYKELEKGVQECLLPIDCPALKQKPTLLKNGEITYQYFCNTQETSVENCQRCEAGEYPSVGRQLISYASSVGDWALTGRKVRTDEEVEEILKICSGCKHFDASRGRCKACGCRMNTGGNAVTNKIRMASEHCIKGKW